MADELTKTMRKAMANHLRRAHRLLERGHLVGPGNGGGEFLPLAVNARGDWVHTRSKEAVAWCAQGALCAASPGVRGRDILERGRAGYEARDAAREALYRSGLHHPLGVWNDHWAKPGEVELLFGLVAEAVEEGGL